MTKRYRRRELFRIAGAGAIVGVAAACAPTDPTGGAAPTAATATTTIPTSSPKPSPRAGGTLTWAKSGEVRRLDPALNGGLVSWDVLYRVYERLVGVKDDGQIEPLLASSWETASDTAYVFHLRKGVRFSNGREMTADDVVTSLTRAADPKVPGATFAVRFADIQQVVKVDPSTVRIELKQPSAVLLPALAGINGAILGGQELVEGKFDPTKETLGTGPFMVKDHKQDESWSLVRNPHYWREGHPLADELTIRIMGDTSARIAALKSGTADIATFDSADTESLLAGSPNVTVKAQTTSDFYYWGINALTPLEPKLKDPRVRRALALAVDRNQIIALALAGKGEPVIGGTTIPSLADACDPSKLPPPDKDQARRLLTEAGALPLTLTLDVLTSFPVFGAISQVIQQQLREIDVTLQLNQLEAGQWTDRYVKATFDSHVSFNAGFMDNWFALQEGGFKPNRAHFMPEMPAFASRLDETRAAGPGPARAAVFQEMCSEIADLAVLIPVATRTTYVGYRSDRVAAELQGFEPNNNPLKNVANFGRS